MPILTLVIPQLKTESMKWKLEGRAVARQCQISRSLFPVLAAPSPSGQSSSFSALLFSLLFFFFFCFFFLFFYFFSSSSHFFSIVCCLLPLLVTLLLPLLLSCLFSCLLPLQLTLVLILLPAPCQIFFCDARAMPNLINTAKLAILCCLSVKPEAVSGGTCKKRQHC